MKTKISTYQTTLLLVNAIVGTAILFLPKSVIHEAKQDAWLAGILLIIFALISSYVYSFLTQRMGNMDLITFNRQVFGKFLTIPLGIGLFIHFLIISGSATREISEIMVAVYLPNTPLWFFNLTTILTAAILVYYGLEIIARSFEIIFYFLVIAFIVGISILIKDISPVFLQPVLGNGLKPLLDGIYPGLLFFSELFIVLIFAPQMVKKDQVHKVLFRAIMIIGSLFLIVILASLMTFGAELAANLTFPLLSVNRYAKGLKVLERLDPLFIFYWIGGGIFKVSLFLYGAVYIGQKLLQLSTYYVLIPVALPILFYISTYHFQNITALTTFLEQTIPYFLSVQLLYPLLLLIVSSLRGVKAND